jgi:GAF domain-containing protein
VLDVQHNIVNGLTEQDADLIQAIASQVGIAVQNAQAYQRAQRQAEREARIVAINQHIQAATSIDDVLKVAVSELGEALGARKSNIDLKVNVSSQDGRN